MFQLKIVLSCLVVRVFAVQPEWGGSSSDGFLQSGKNWQHLSQICFGSQRGVLVKFEYEFSYLKSCEARQSVLLRRQSQRIINLTESDRHSGCSSMIKNGYIKCSDRRKFLARSSCWHFVISNCNSRKGIQMQYYISIKEDKPEKIEISSSSTTEPDVAKALNGGMNNLGTGHYLAVTTALVFGAIYSSAF